MAAHGELEVRETCVVEDGSDRGVWHLDGETNRKNLVSFSFPFLCLLLSPKSSHFLSHLLCRQHQRTPSVVQDDTLCLTIWEICIS